MPDFKFTARISSRYTAVEAFVVQTQAATSQLNLLARVGRRWLKRFALTLKGDSEAAVELRKELERNANGKSYDPTSIYFPPVPPASPQAFPRVQRTCAESMVVNLMGGEDNMPGTCKLS